MMKFTSTLTTAMIAMRVHRQPVARSVLESMPHPARCATRRWCPKPVDETGERVAEAQEQQVEAGALGAWPGVFDPRAGDFPASVWGSSPETEGLAGRTVIVTGAGRTIGRAIAISLGEAGANVVVNARSNREDADAVVADVNATKGQAIAVLGDVGDPSFDEELVQKAVDTFGSVDVLVSNAARRKRQPFLDITFDDWDTIVRSNLSASFYLAKLVLPGMVDRRWGRIVNIGGPDGQRGSPYRAHNVSCKAGLIGLTKAISIEFAHAGITANVVVPGVMDTSRNPVDYPNWPPSRKNLAGRVPAARMGTSEEVAYACRFLASNAAAYITGQTLHVNGGEYMP
jgi:NAD(P)-dependent dehydrogenase (short-subunit alcohol dehydrogenase family)